jgi:hypothetical protein
MSDITFLVEEQKVYGHKALLGLRSEYFKTLFSSGMRDSSASEIFIPNVKYETFLEVLRYVYTGQVTVTSETAIGLLEASNFYKVEGLKAQCEYVLHLNIDLDSVCNLLEIADRFDARKLRQVCLEHLLDHYEVVTTSQAFQEMERELLVYVMKEACKRLNKT